MGSFPRKSRPKPDIICRYSSLETEKDLFPTNCHFRTYLPNIAPSLLLQGYDETSVVLATHRPFMRGGG